MSNLTSYGSGQIATNDGFTGNETFACLAVVYDSVVSTSVSNSTGAFGFTPSRCTQTTSDVYQKDYFCYIKGVRGTEFI
jgi:hypothetical protein